MECMDLLLSCVPQRSCRSPSAAAVAQVGRMSTNVSWPLYCISVHHTVWLCYGHVLWCGSEYKSRSPISCEVSRLDTRASQESSAQHGTILLARHVCVCTWIRFILVIMAFFSPPTSKCSTRTASPRVASWSSLHSGTAVSARTSMMQCCG